MNQKRYRRRMRAGLGIFFALVLVFSGKLVSLQVVQGADYSAQAQRVLARVETVEAARGEIFDRAGRPLVSNAVRYELSLALGEMGDQPAQTLRRLLALCRREGIAPQDGLPIDWNSPYRYEAGAGAEMAVLEEYLARIGTERSESAQQLMDYLSQHYGLPQKLSVYERRALVGIYYERALRQLQLRWQPYVFAEGDAAFLGKLRELGLPGIESRAVAARRYETAAAAHILGRVGPMDAEEWAHYQALGYAMDEAIGKDGAEQAFEDLLRAQRGELRDERDPEGHLIGRAYTRAPQPGQTLFLTLDLPLQERAEALLSEQLAALPAAEGAALVVLDVNDGAVRALCSYPSFSLANFSRDYAALREDARRPLFNRALQGLYAPGSTFKMVTAAAALEEGIITPETQILDTGRYTYYRAPQPSCWLYRERGETHGLETVSEAITDSCNVFFYDIGRRLGIARLGDYARRFGLGEQSGIELAGEAEGVVAGPEYSAAQGQLWYEGSTLSAAIGQENMRFTPLQLAAYTAMLANGGARMQPHLLQETRSFDTDETLFRQQPQLRGRIPMAAENLRAIHEGMLAVTQSGALAAQFQDLPVAVAAKTGSVQVAGSEEANAVFLCFAPYEEPEIALAIVVEKGGAGAELGALAAAILAFYFAPEETEAAEEAPPLETAAPAEAAGDGS